MKHTTKSLAIFCTVLAIAVFATACNLDSEMGILEAISNSQPTLDTTNQSILGFKGDYVYIKAQDGIYKYGSTASDVTQVDEIALMTNGIATSIGKAQEDSKFVYQIKSGSSIDYKTYNLSDASIVDYSTSNVSGMTMLGMHNGMALFRNDNENAGTSSYGISILAENGFGAPTYFAEDIDPQDKGPGIFFSFDATDWLATLIETFENADNEDVYQFSYFWNDSTNQLNQLDIADNTDGDLADIVELDYPTNHATTENSNFIRIQAFQPATGSENGKKGVALARISNDETTSLVFVQNSVGGPLEYLGEADFTLNYYSPSAMASARVTIGGTDYMLVPYLSGMRLIDLTDENHIKNSTIDNASDYAYPSTKSGSFAYGLTYNNVVDIEPLPNMDDTDTEKNKYLVSTVNNGVFTITLPTAAGNPSNVYGSQAVGYHPI